MSTLKLDRLIGGGRKLQIDFWENVRLGAGGPVITRSLPDLGPDDPTRMLLVRFFTRTNTTTGERRFLSCSADLGAGAIPGTFIVGHGIDGANVSNPCALMTFPIPTGQTGDLTITMNGASTSHAAAHLGIYTIKGRYSQVDAQWGGSEGFVNLNTGPAGQIVHGAWSSADVPVFGGYSNQDEWWDGAVMKAIGGRIKPTGAGTITLESSPTARILAVSYRQG